MLEFKLGCYSLWLRRSAPREPLKSIYTLGPKRHNYIKAPTLKMPGGGQTEKIQSDDYDDVLIIFGFFASLGCAPRSQ